MKQIPHLLPTLSALAVALASAALLVVAEPVSAHAPLQAPQSPEDVERSPLEVQP